MDRNALIEEVKQYFTGSDHWRRLCSALQDPDPEGTHIHAYVETSVHPDSLEAIMKGYFAKKGWPSRRKIDHMAPKAGMGSLHGVEPRGKPHFDFQWFFNRDVGLRACEGGESGCNLLIWNRYYISQFYRQFPFRKIGAQERKDLKAYFESDHFLKGLEFPLMPTTNHMHINVHTSIHPDTLTRYAEEALEREGIKIYYTCPNVYLVGSNYRGKLVFLSKKPEVVFDLGWQFVPDVVIEPAWETWIFEASPGYDIWMSDMLAEVMKADYITLDKKEIDEILKSCR